MKIAGFTFPDEEAKRTFGYKENINGQPNPQSAEEFIWNKINDFYYEEIKTNTLAYEQSQAAATLKATVDSKVNKEMFVKNV